MADRRLMSDGSDADGQRYGPRVDPLNTSSPAKEVLIYRLTGTCSHHHYNKMLALCFNGKLFSIFFHIKFVLNSIWSCHS